MNLGEIRQFCNYLVNKDQLGNPATPEQFQTLLRSANLTHYDLEWQKLLRIHDQKGTPIIELVYDSSPLMVFAEEKTSSVYEFMFLPGDYKYYLALKVQYSDTQALLDCDIMPIIKANQKAGNTLRGPDESDPFAYVKDSKMWILPKYNGINTIFCVLDYLRLPVEPVFDYCIDLKGNEIYMPPGYSINTYAQLIDSDGNVVNNYVVHPTVTTLPYDSRSVELDWAVDQHINIAHQVIAFMSVKDMNHQTGMYSEQKAKE